MHENGRMTWHTTTTCQWSSQIDEQEQIDIQGFKLDYGVPGKCQ